jgi:hypothetical protein
MTGAAIAWCFLRMEGGRGVVLPTFDCTCATHTRRGSGDLRTTCPFHLPLHPMGRASDGPPPVLLSPQPPTPHPVGYPCVTMRHGGSQIAVEPVLQGPRRSRPQLTSGGHSHATPLPLHSHPSSPGSATDVGHGGGWASLGPPTLPPTLLRVSSYFGSSGRLLSPRRANDPSPPPLSPLSLLRAQRNSTAGPGDGALPRHGPMSAAAGAADTLKRISVVGDDGGADTTTASPRVSAGATVPDAGATGATAPGIPRQDPVPTVSFAGF